ncbi:MAG: thiamine pyrophosphate-dependent enzyme [Candidatus Bathyarchaeia archaeon]
MSQVSIIPPERVTIPTTAACQGCPMVLIARHTLDTLGRKTAVVIPASCGGWSGMMWVPRGMTQFGSTAAAATGLKRAYDALGKKDINVAVIAGDGGTYDIGLQSLSGATERRENIIWVCQNNQAYMNTGIQRSGATPKYAWTTTTPVGKLRKGKQAWQKDVATILESQGAAYVAKASVAYIADFKRKVRKAQRISTVERKGLSYIEALNTCPTGWRYDSGLSVRVARLAVQTGLWPLYEVEEGRFRLTVRPKEILPVAEYLKVQGRFRHLTENQIEEIQSRTTDGWEGMLARVGQA